jgi:uncharacterized protein
MLRASVVFLIGLLLLLGTAFADPIAVPALTARVTDQTGTLDATQMQSLEATLAAFEQAKGSQIAVLIVPTTGDETIEEYSIRVTDQWKLGRKGIDDGVLLLVAKNDRKARIEVGKGLEGVIPDAIANRIIDEDIAPRFKLGDFDGGLQAGVARVSGLINGEPLPPPKPQRNSGDSHARGDPSALIAVFLIARVLFFWAPTLARGGLTAAAVGLFSLFFGFGVLITLVGAFLSFFFAMVGNAGGRYTGMGRSGGWGGGSSSGFGGGGFSGGGGGFSGGGASGGW